MLWGETLLPYGVKPYLIAPVCRRFPCLCSDSTAGISARRKPCTAALASGSPCLQISRNLGRKDNNKFVDAAFDGVPLEICFLTQVYFEEFVRGKPWCNAILMQCCICPCRYCDHEEGCAGGTRREQLLLRLDI